VASTNWIVGSMMMLGLMSAPLGVEARDLSQPPTTIAAGASAMPPIGWVQFCQSDQTTCNGPSERPRAVRLDEQRWRQVSTVNQAVNDAITPLSDMEQWGVVERWSLPETGAGDCEDYVLEKRKRLLAAGFPRSSLLITVVRDKKGDGHAVLMIKSDRGDYILDNQENKILLWHQTGYTFLKRQSQELPNRWVALGGGDPAITTAQP